MNWNELISEITAVGSSGDSTEPITGIEYDSRRVRPGSVFVAMKGGSTDGNRYIDKAIAAGASASSPTHRILSIILLSTSPNSRCSKSNMAAAPSLKPRQLFSDIPSASSPPPASPAPTAKPLLLFLIEALFNAAARKTVLIGTIEYHVAGEVRPSVHTTPESRDLFELMAEGAARGVTELVTEVSSHGLDQGRATGINFDVALFTNLTRDHLDYHGTMENYFAAKSLLFDGSRYPAPRVAVMNAHDPRTPETRCSRAQVPEPKFAPTASASATSGRQPLPDARRRMILNRPQAPRVSPHISLAK